MKTILLAAVVVGVWLAPVASADPPDQAYLAFLAANKVKVDAKTAIDGARVACAQIAKQMPESMIATIVSTQVPAVNGAEYWITAGARQVYCPHAGD